MVKSSVKVIVPGRSFMSSTIVSLCGVTGPAKPSARIRTSKVAVGGAIGSEHVAWFETLKVNGSVPRSLVPVAPAESIVPKLAVSLRMQSTVGSSVAIVTVTFWRGWSVLFWMRIEMSTVSFVSAYVSPSPLSESPATPATTTSPPSQLM